jgi:RND family efflux transporter MFP subunit
MDAQKISGLKITDSGQFSVTRRRPKTLWLIVIAAAAVVILLYLFQAGLLTSAARVRWGAADWVYPSQVITQFNASGYVVAQRKASIASKATGRLISLGYEEGDRVKKGEIIGRIENGDVEAALEQAKANLELSIADRNDAKQTLERAKNLFSRQLISQADLDAAQARFDRVTASISGAQAGVKAAEVQVENTLIRAPFDGTVLTKNADVGEVVTPFAAGASSRVAVVTIADMTSLEVEADVSESNIERITPQEPCEVVLDAYPDVRYKGYVNKIVPTADRSKATVMTKIRFVERDSRVLPEMSAKVFFLSKEMNNQAHSTPKLAVSASAIATRADHKVVFLCKDNAVTETLVELGISLGEFVEIRSGLSAGDRVVLKPSQDLQSGMKVKLKQ